MENRLNSLLLNVCELLALPNTIECG